MSYPLATSYMQSCCWDTGMFAFLHSCYYKLWWNILVVTTTSLFQLAIHWPDVRTLSWVCGFTICIVQLQTLLGGITATPRRGRGGVCNRLFNCLLTEPWDGNIVAPLLQDRLGKILVVLLQLINYLPGNRTQRWLHCSAIAAAAGKFRKNIGNPLATGYSLAWWRNQEMVALFNHCCRQVEEIIGNPLATDKLLAWWRNPEMVALFHHCCRTGWEEYWQPSCNW